MKQIIMLGSVSVLLAIAACHPQGNASDVSQAGAADVNSDATAAPSPSVAVENEAAVNEAVASAGGDGSTASTSGAIWQIVDKNTAFYGDAGSDNGDNLICEPEKAQLRFVRYEASEKNGSAVTLDAGGKGTFAGKVVYDSGGDEGMESVAIAIPLGEPLVDALIGGAAPLGIRWGGDTADALPITPSVVKFVADCRSRAKAA